MASLAALVRDNTTLNRDQIPHLNRLMSEWGMLADFCFADLLLYVPHERRAVAHRRPGPPGHRPDDLPHRLGRHVRQRHRASVLSPAFESGEITEGDVEVEDLPDPTRMLAVPVRCDGRPIAVLTREWVAAAGPAARRARADLPRRSSTGSRR